MIDDLQPRAEEPVELSRARGRRGLRARPRTGRGTVRKNRSILPFVRRRAGTGVDQLRAQHRARPQQLRGHERRAAIDEHALRDAARHQRRPQRGLQAEDVLAGHPAPADQHPRVIVDERQQHRPTAGRGELGAMQPVAGPELVRRGRFKAAVDLARRAPVGAVVQAGARQVRLQRPRRRRPGLAGRGQDRVDLRRRAVAAVLALERDRQLEHPRRRPRQHLARLRDQALR